MIPVSFQNRGYRDENRVTYFMGLISVKIRVNYIFQKKLLLAELKILNSF